MREIDPQDLLERENYRLLVSGIIPRPIAFVTTMSEDGVVNGAPFSYFSIVSAKPPMIALSIQRKADGTMKDTARNALHKGEFVVHVADHAYIEQLNQTAKNLPPDESEIRDAELTLIKSGKVAVPGIQEAKLRFECRLETSLSLGENSASCDLLIGRIVYYHVDEAALVDGVVDAQKLQPVSRLGGNDYALLGQTFSLERPI